MRPSRGLALLATGATILFAGLARAEDAGLPALEWKGTNGATVTFYGQINKGVLRYDDGAATDTYGLIDNNNSGTRAGLRYSQPLAEGWTLGSRIEIGYAPYSTANVNQLHPDSGDWDFTNANIRWIDFSAKSAEMGTVSLGQGSMATDGIAEIDKSGTDVIAYASVGDSATAQLLRPEIAGIGPDTFGPEIGSAYNDYDGNRIVRLRYDTRAFGGFTVSAAFGRALLADTSAAREINQYDAALRYEGALGDVSTEAGVGYFANDDDQTRFSGSVSALHGPTGLNGTFAAGTLDDDGQSGRYWYGKLGLIRGFVGWGKTAVSADYYAGDDIYTASGVSYASAGGDPIVEGDITSSTSKSWGVALVQNIDAWNTELWLTYRSYDYSDNLARYGDGQALFGGARFSF